MELTKEYFDKQLKSLATKNDLNELKTDVAGVNHRVTTIDQRVDNLKTFLDENMVTKQELSDLRDELPTRAEFSRLQTSVDGIAKQFLDQQQEQTIGSSRTSRMEAWIIKAAAKIGLEYKP
jgi:hypothetical protein